MDVRFELDRLDEMLESVPDGLTHFVHQPIVTQTLRDDETVLLPVLQLVLRKSVFHNQLRGCLKSGRRIDQGRFPTDLSSEGGRRKVSACDTIRHCGIEPVRGDLSIVSIQDELDKTRSQNIEGSWGMNARRTTGAERQGNRPRRRS